MFLIYILICRITKGRLIVIMHHFVFSGSLRYFEGEKEYLKPATMFKISYI